MQRKLDEVYQPGMDTVEVRLDDEPAGSGLNSRKFCSLFGEWGIAVSTACVKQFVKCQEHA